jgi:hypothetical protein
MGLRKVSTAWKAKVHLSGPPGQYRAAPPIKTLRRKKWNLESVNTIWVELI